MKKIGIVGGTFNPIHLGHLIIAERFIDEMELDKALLIPTNISPFKAGIDKDFVDPIHRINMLKIAVEKNPRFDIDLCEIERGEASYTIDTVRYLNAKLDAELYLLIGEDQAEKFHLWKDYKEIMEIVQVCVARRNEENTEKRVYSEEFIKNSIFIDSPIIEFSSTEIRARIKNGKSVKYMTDDNIIDYILDKELYKR
jgi:nicotinate-nucleotide adenylyltransferase